MILNIGENEASSSPLTRCLNSAGIGAGSQPVCSGQEEPDSEIQPAVSTGTTTGMFSLHCYHVSLVIWLLPLLICILTTKQSKVQLLPTFQTQLQLRVKEQNMSSNFSAVSKKKCQAVQMSNKSVHSNSSSILISNVGSLAGSRRFSNQN